ncbi:hypothetical protein [Paenibacillus mesophilus]|nr:hypothetical protein [Paenibacillus mesophilus]
MMVPADWLLPHAAKISIVAPFPYISQSCRIKAEFTVLEQHINPFVRQVL